MADSNSFLAERERRMAENKRRLEAMGLAEASAKLAASMPAKAKKAPKGPRVARPQSRDPSQPGRRSDRNKGKEVNYNERQPLAVYEERELRKALKRPRSDNNSSSNIRGAKEGWHPGIPEPPFYARDLAVNAAVEKIEHLTTHDKAAAFAKELTFSMVSNGFWLQAPPGLQHHLPVDTTITFTTTDKARPEEQFRHTQFAINQRKKKKMEGEPKGRNDAWPVRYIQRRNKKGQPAGGQGFSGNWRGVAIDLFLHLGDFVVFEVVNSTEVKVHVFRCWDYAQPEDIPKGFDGIRFTSAAEAEADQQKQPTSLTDSKGSAVGDGDQQEPGAKKQRGQQAGVGKRTAVPAASVKAQKQSNSNKKDDSSKGKRKQQSAPAADAAAVATGKDVVKSTKDQSAASTDAASKRSRRGNNSSNNSKGVDKPDSKNTGRRRKAAAAVSDGVDGGSRKRTRKVQAPLEVDGIMDA